MSNPAIFRFPSRTVELEHQTASCTLDGRFLPHLYPGASQQISADPLSADRPLGFDDNQLQYQSINLHVTARGGVAYEESVFERSLSSTVTVNPIRVSIGGEVTRKVDIEGTQQRMLSTAIRGTF